MNRVKKFWSNNKGFIVFIFLMLFFRSAVADWYHVPSGSMQPNILIGDRVWVDKLAYDVKIPMTDINLKRHNEPTHGDVIVFNSKRSQDRLIKRVIGLPGDVIEMKANHLYVNGNKLELKAVLKPTEFDQFLNDRDVAEYFVENLEQSVEKASEHVIRVTLNKHSFLSSFPPVKVPTDHLWVMGDNRDNSADSRVIGMVPRKELVGKANKVVISFDPNNYYLPRTGRYLVRL